MTVKVSLTGNVGGEPEFRTSKAGKDYCEFSVATWTGVKGADRWWQILVFREGVNYVRDFVAKGSYIQVSGTFGFETYQDKTGSHREKFRCLADEVRVVAKPVAKSEAPKQDFGERQNPFTVPLKDNAFDVNKIPF